VLYDPGRSYRTLVAVGTWMSDMRPNYHVSVLCQPSKRHLVELAADESEFQIRENGWATVRVCVFDLRSAPIFGLTFEGASSGRSKLASRSRQLMSRPSGRTVHSVRCACKAAMNMRSASAPLDSSSRPSRALTLFLVNGNGAATSPSAPRETRSCRIAALAAPRSWRIWGCIAAVPASVGNLPQPN